MKLQKRNLSILSILLVFVIAVPIGAWWIQNSSIGPRANLVVYGAGTPDALGNKINQLIISQNTTGSWTTVTSLSAASYVVNYTLSIPANQHTIVVCEVYLNSSLAPDLPTAQSRTRVYLNISGVVTNFAMICYSGTSVVGYWVCDFAYPSSLGSPTTTWIPATDTTYNCTFQYQAYY